MSPQIVAALAAVTSTAEAYAQALRGLAVAAGIDPGTMADKVLTDARNTASAVAYMVAERDRPKGLIVRTVYLERDVIKGDAGSTEIIRTTVRRAVPVRGCAYDLATGIEIKGGGYYSSKRMIHPEDLATVRAMKPGHSDVSKALAALNGGAK